MQDCRGKSQWGQVEANRDVVLKSRGDHGRMWQRFESPRRRYSWGNNQPEVCMSRCGRVETIVVRVFYKEIAYVER
jgi:hypothetical protein